MELYGRVRYAVQIEGLSHREVARQFGIDPRTVAKMVKFSVPPGYVRKRPPARPRPSASIHACCRCQNIPGHSVGEAISLSVNRPVLIRPIEDRDAIARAIAQSPRRPEARRTTL
ncbi:MAG: FeoC-like transcriptional regulator [Methylocella sp.]